MEIHGKTYIGDRDKSEGVVTIESSGEFKTNDRAWVARQNGSDGEVGIDGGTWNAGGDIIVAEGVGATGEISVKNGSLTAGMDVDIYGFGDVTADSGGTITVSGTTTIWNMGKLSVKSGATVESAILNNKAGGTGGGTIDIKRDGTLKSPDATNNGTVTADGKAIGKFKNENILIIGGMDPKIGRFIIDGEFEQYAGGATKIEIDGTAPNVDYDVLHVVNETGSGSAMLGGTLDVSGTYSPQAWNVGGNGDMFSVLTATGSLSGEFDTVNLPAAGSGKSWVVVYDGMDSYDEVLADEYPLFENNQPWVGNGLNEVILLVAEHEILVNDVDVNEADGNATFDVTLTVPSDSDVYVDLDTQDVSATAPDDYAVTSVHPIVFSAGQTKVTVDVPIMDDDDFELTESFDVLLTNAVGATIEDGNAVGTIFDNDAIIGDFVWHDLNGDGIQDAGEPGMEQVQVDLLDDTNGYIASALTDSDGKYEFREVPAGSYKLQFIPPPNYEITLMDQTTDTLDSDADSTDGGRTVAFTVGVNEDVRHLDAGLVASSSGLYIRGMAWMDDDEDGIRSMGESGMPSIEVKLFDANGMEIATAMTDSGGYYEFAGLAAGDYSIQFDASMYGFTEQDQGSDDTVDSDVDSFGMVYLSLATENKDNVDAGLIMSSW